MHIETWITIEGRNKYGQLISYKKEQAHSPVMNFINLLAVNFGYQTVTATDTSDVSRSCTMGAPNMRVDAPANIDTYGIVVGTGSTAVAIGNTKLVSQVLNGTGSGQLSHSITSVTAPSTSGTSQLFNVSRIFTNSSGANITVNEVGLVGLSGASNYKLLLDRTLNSFTIANLESKTVTYTVKVTV